MNDPTREHILLTVLGTNPQPTTYVWDGRSEVSNVAPAALYALLRKADRPDRVLALCTPEAENDSLPELSRSLGTRCPVEVVRIISDPTDEAIHTCLAGLAERVPPGADLTVDVTHGFRHLAFLTYVGVLYLTALRGVRLRAAYYGMLRPHDDPSPFFDLRPLVELPSWFHALRVLADAGSAHAMADLVAASGGEAGGKVADALRTLSEAYASGLPIELGHLSRRFLAEQVEPLQTLLHRNRLPLAEELVRAFSGMLAEQQLAQDLSGPSWKASATLDRAELVRQVQIIDGFLDRRDYPTAFGLMREWLVLWAMWRTGAERRWLNYYDRKPTENLLHNLDGRIHPGTPHAREWSTISKAWEHLRTLRNAYAHHGLDERVTLSTDDAIREKVEGIVRIWREMLRAVPEIPLDPPRPEGRVLVSPVGLRPGVLFSALLAAQPDRVTDCLVICSADTERSIEPACQAAGYAGTVNRLRLDDPFGGVPELSRRLGEARQHLRGAGEVFVNITGGTTLMGVLADRIAGKARRPDGSVHVRRFALIDRRSAAEQEDDPYQQGEVCWLDDQPGRADA